MPIQELNKIFDMDKDSFSGYFSDSEITDIDEKYIGSTIDVEDLTKISRQLDVSMRSMMNLMDGFSVTFSSYCLSPVQDHHREKCAVYFHGKNPGIYKRRNQPAVHYVHVYRGRAVHLDQPAIGAGNHADSVPGNDADKHYRLDHILHRSEDFRGNVRERRGGICRCGSN